MKPHRRGPWPPPIVVERRRYPQVGEHSHRQPRWPVISLSAAVLVLTAAVIVLAVFVADFADYIAGRGAYRDRETQRVEQSVKDAVCDVLDALPPGPRLDPIRENYGCGPGATSPPD